MDTMQTLEDFIKDFIKDHFVSKADFARQLGVFPQQITQWQNANYMVHNGVMFKPMRQIAEIENA